MKFTRWFLKQNNENIVLSENSQAFKHTPDLEKYLLEMILARAKRNSSEIFETNISCLHSFTLSVLTENATGAKSSSLWKYQKSGIEICNLQVKIEFAGSVSKGAVLQIYL